jgi:hypothetical protein
MTHPASQQFRIRRFHDLKAARTARFHPARVVDDALREHPPATFEAFTNQRDATRLEVLDDHEEHAPQFTPAWTRVKGQEQKVKMENRKSQIEERNPKIEDGKSIFANPQSQITNRKSPITNGKSSINNRQFRDSP